MSHSSYAAVFFLETSVWYPSVTFFFMKFETFSRFLTLVSQLLKFALLLKFATIFLVDDFFHQVVTQWRLTLEQIGVPFQKFLEQVVLLLKQGVAYQKQISVTSSQTAIFSQFQVFHPDLVPVLRDHWDSVSVLIQNGKSYHEILEFLASQDLERCVTSEKAKTLIAVDSPQKPGVKKIMIPLWKILKFLSGKENS